jgi:hypothetical protein
MAWKLVAGAAATPEFVHVLVAAAATEFVRLSLVVSEGDQGASTEESCENDPIPRYRHDILLVD